MTTYFLSVDLVALHWWSSYYVFSHIPSFLLFFPTIVDLHFDPFFFVLITTFINTSPLLGITQHYVPQPFPSDFTGLRKASFVDHVVVSKFAAIVERLETWWILVILLFIFLCFVLRGELFFWMHHFDYWQGKKDIIRNTWHLKDIMANFFHNFNRDVI